MKRIDLLANAALSFPFQLLGEIEEHLDCTVPEIFDDFKIETNEFDGKVVYGTK